MKGRAHRLLQEFQAKLVGARAPFLMSRLVLMAHVVPSQVTPETDDPQLEKRIEEAVARLMSEAPRTPEI